MSGEARFGVKIGNACLMMALAAICVPVEAAAHVGLRAMQKERNCIPIAR